MAKSRAQRKAEQRRKREQALESRARESQAKAQHDTQVPESGDVAEVEAVIETGALPPDDGAPVDGSPDKITRRERRRQEKEQEARARASAERRAPKAPQVERERGAVASFFSSVLRELGKVQWPDRDTLVQASAVTLLFVAVAAAYLGALDAIFNKLVDLVI